MTTLSAFKILAISLFACDKVSKEFGESAKMCSSRPKSREPSLLLSINVNLILFFFTKKSIVLSMDLCSIFELIIDLIPRESMDCFKNQLLLSVPPEVKKISEE